MTSVETTSAAATPVAGSGPVTVRVGTRKGAWTLNAGAGRTDWDLSEPTMLGHVIQHVMADPREPSRVLMATRTGHLGPTVMRSEDGGATWVESQRPPAFTPGDPHGRAVRSAFWLSPALPSQPGTWFVGASPQGLFRTDDHGDTWEPVSGWNDHPQWSTWAEWPDVEGTPDGSMLHSVNIDPRDPQHLSIALSGGGVFESTDGGADWAPLNSGCA
jgi:photosystem II stability/assembly factor-like uncharacterized protein